ncbi:MAG: 5-methylcytosine-specific restriction endonuclease system specificity protein McrC [Candidatus Dadabacteria bacterium]|nr:MAG: 5-methylcytosine-specific restriction endonuclease system specificity protein McrC [Candidatus Dadabacteria bacterium]
MSKIPIQNIYYLLCYAWDRLEEKDLVDVSGTDCTELADLFARVLVNGVNRLLKQGIDRGYITVESRGRTLRGKLDFGKTLKENLLSNAKVACVHDDLSYDVLHNRILKATLRLLSSAEKLNSKNRENIFGLLKRLQGISDIKLSVKDFRRVQLTRNNRFYDFLLKVCELVYDNLLVTEKAGKSKFRDFIRDEDKMPMLFEHFVYNFYRNEQSDYRVSADILKWEAEPLNEESEGYLPNLHTDICLTNKERKIIIDTKFYKKALQEHRAKEIVQPEHLYQIFSYLMNVKPKDFGKEKTGILLYPTVNSELDLAYKLHGHTVLIKTVNLAGKWQEIDCRLKEIIKQIGGVKSGLGLENFQSSSALRH